MIYKAGNDDHGNWLSGINFVDNLLEGVRKTQVMCSRKQRKEYLHFLPLLGESLALFSKSPKPKNNFLVLLVFFLYGACNLHQPLYFFFNLGKGLFISSSFMYLL
jgi:hypothetical protein